MESLITPNELTLSILLLIDESAAEGDDIKDLKIMIENKKSLFSLPCFRLLRP
jgi:hypothetical protein